LRTDAQKTNRENHPQHMNLFLKTNQKISEEETDRLSDGIAFVKPETSPVVAKTKDYNTLKAEFSITDGGIELEDSQQKPDLFNTTVLENKNIEAKSDLQKVSKNKVVILPENHNGSDFPEDDDIPSNLKKRK
jgi:hypothetical protein